MKIIHVISSLIRGGRERQLATIVSNTDLDRYPTKIIYFNKKKYSYIEKYGLHDKSIRLESRGKIPRLVELHRILKREKPDVVYTWGNGESVSVLLLSPFHRYRFINGSIRHGIRAPKFSQYLRTIVLHLSQHVVANSRAGLKANNLRRGKVLYNGIDGKFLVPVPEPVLTRQQLTGISPEVPLLISVANLVPYKDYFSVLKALKLLREAGHSFFYLILGDGPMYPSIIKTIEAFDLAWFVKVVGNVDNVDDYLKVSDIFIHSSKGEGCSNAILEAMASGLPIVASDTGGTGEIVKPENGALFPYKSDNRLFELLNWLFNNPDVRIHMGQRSREKVRDEFSITQMMQNYYSILHSVNPQAHEKPLFVD